MLDKHVRGQHRIVVDHQDALGGETALRHAASSTVASGMPIRHTSPCGLLYAFEPRAVAADWRRFSARGWMPIEPFPE